MDEVFAADEPISAVVTSDDPSHAVDAVISDAATGRSVIESREEAVGDGTYRAEWPPLPPGDYRLTMSTADPDSDREPVHSVFIVAEADEDPGPP